MWRVTLKGVVAHRLRYALMALAVLLGVAFIAGTFVLTDTMNSAFNGLYSQIYQGTAVVVRATQPFNPGTNFTNQRQLTDSSLASTVAAVPGVRAVALDIEGYAQLVGKDGKPIGTVGNGAPTLGVAWTDVTALDPLRLLPGGQPPRGPGQVVIDKHSADVGGFTVGDTVRILTQQGPGTYTITGIVTFGSADNLLGATIAGFDPVTAAKVLAQPGKTDAIDVEAAPGVSAATLVTRISSAIHNPGIEVVSGASVTAEGEQTIHQDLSYVGDFLLAFGFIALFVGAFVIFNTFAMVVAQRQRELALLRAVGASRGQVLGTVLGESAIIGLIASAVGVIAGVGLAVALRKGLAALGVGLPGNGLVVSPRAVLFGLAAGTLVTAASAIVPARRAATIPPVAALQDAAAEPLQPSLKGAGMRASRRVIMAAAGILILTTGLFGHTGNRLTFVGIGAVLVFIGVAVFAPFAVRPVCRVPLRASGTSGTLGERSAMRNPSRTSATAAALMVGVALVSMTTIMASSLKASADSTLNSAMRADFVVGSGTQPGGSSGLSPDLERSLAALPQVSTVAGIRSGVVKVFGAVTPVVAADPAKAAQLFDVGVTQGYLATMTPAGIGVSTQVASSQHLHLGSMVAVTYPTTGTKNYTVQVIYSVRDIAGDYVLPLAAAQANFPSSLDIAIFLKLAPGVTANAARPALNRVLAAYPNATLQDQDQYKASQS